MHWKIRRDPYLARLAERHGEEAVWASGFFLDEDEDDASLDDVDWRCTPLPRSRGAGGERPAVLLSTGAFCPVHAGHIAMMESARTAAEGAGFDILGGYLSPGHDAYIRLKCGRAAIPAPERLRLCGDAARESGWLSVDPWEALHRRVAVNFTDVAARLRAYLRAHLDPRVEVLYVCGGDNARFALAFLEEGGCVVVGRRGSSLEYSSWRARLSAHPRILWGEGEHPGASRLLRSASPPEQAKKSLVLRLEDDRAVRTLGLTTLTRFQGELASLLSEHAVVRAAPLQEPGQEAGIISLDAMLPSRHNLAVSRLFAPGGYQLLGHVPRPGAPPLDEQLAAIPRGVYTLRDDDRMTGGTLAAIRAILPTSLSISNTCFAVPHDPDEEISDSRDFLLGADDGGLVIELPDGRGEGRSSVGRAPYILPYVDPAVRCCIPPGQARVFSAKVWALNERMFLGTGLCVRDLPGPARATFGWLGESYPLDELCRWHIARMERTNPHVR